VISLNRERSTKEKGVSTAFRGKKNKKKRSFLRGWRRRESALYRKKLHSSGKQEENTNAIFRGMLKPEG